MGRPKRKRCSVGSRDSGRAVSRILSSLLRAERIICLSSQYPGPIRFRGTGAGRSVALYLALHPMGFSVPRRSRFERCALTAPFHPYPHRSLSRFPLSATSAAGGLFSVALSVEEPRGPVACVYLNSEEPSYAASRPVVFGLSSFRLRRKRFSALPKSNEK